MTIRTFLVLASLLACGGCAWFGGDALEKPIQELVQDGVEAYEDGDFKEAIKNFEQLKDWYPFSKYAILAELKIADAHYQLEEYAEAVQAYESFEQLHPRNEAVPYVIYQIGRCYYEQLDTIDRDQTSAQKALDSFDRLIRQYPGTQYAQTAQSHRIRCLRSMSAHDFYVGMFYYNKENYKAALHRFNSVIQNYPDVGMHYRALYLISKCENLIAQQNDEKPNS